MKKFILLLSIAFISCGLKNKVNPNEKDTTFISTLTEICIDSSRYYIALPPDYSLSTSHGPDFDVHYFFPIDTLVIPKYSGGIYFGGYPDLSGEANQTCKKDLINDMFMGDKTKWDCYACDSFYTIETVKEEDSYLKIHAFGVAATKRDMYKLLDIFSTFRKK